MYDYKKEIAKVVESFKNGSITVAGAHSLLIAIEKKAYEMDPNAEPDGDITYLCSIALDEIFSHDRS